MYSIRKDQKLAINKISYLQFLRYLSRRKPGFKPPWDYQ
jgi:hypothetical protein